MNKLAWIAVALALTFATPALAAPVSRSQAVKVAVQDVANYPNVTVDRVTYDAATGRFRVFMTSHSSVPISGYTDVDRVTGEFIASTFCGS